MVATENEKENHLNIAANSTIDFVGVRNILTNNFNNSAFVQVINISKDYLENEHNNINKLQKAIIYLLQARAEIELKNYDNATSLIKNSDKITKELESDNLKCLSLNTKAILHFKQDHLKRSFNLLQKAAELAIRLPGEMRILTLANIAKVLKRNNDPDAEVYQKTAEKMQEEFAFTGLV
jgi:hypothetical protein